LAGTVWADNQVATPKQLVLASAFLRPTENYKRFSTKDLDERANAYRMQQLGCDLPLVLEGTCLPLQHQLFEGADPSPDP